MKDEVTHNELIGRKMKGFRFENERLGFVPEMEQYIGEVGTIDGVYQGYKTDVEFSDGTIWSYPLDQVYEHLIPEAVEEEDPYKCLKEAYKSGKKIEWYNPIFHRWDVVGDPDWTKRPDHYRVRLDKPNMVEENPANTGELIVNGGTITHRTVLQEAEQLINGDRAEQYGKASENFNDIAAGWSVLFKTKVTAEQVALAMGWVKICRFNHKPGRDSIVDLAGYAGCIEKIQKGQ